MEHHGTFFYFLSVWPNILELVYNNVKSDNASELKKKHKNLGLLCNGSILIWVLSWTSLWIKSCKSWVLVLDTTMKLQAGRTKPEVLERNLKNELANSTRCWYRNCSCWKPLRQSSISKNRQQLSEWWIAATNQVVCFNSKDTWNRYWFYARQSLRK